MSIGEPVLTERELAVLEAMEAEFRGRPGAAGRWLRWSLRVVAAGCAGYGMVWVALPSVADHLYDAAHSLSGP